MTSRQNCRPVVFIYCIWKHSGVRTCFYSSYIFVQSLRYIYIYIYSCKNTRINFITVQNSCIIYYFFMTVAKFTSDIYIYIYIYIYMSLCLCVCVMFRAEWNAVSSLQFQLFSRSTYIWLPLLVFRSFATKYIWRQIYLKSLEVKISGSELMKHTIVKFSEAGNTLTCPLHRVCDNNSYLLRFSHQQYLPYVLNYVLHKLLYIVEAKCRKYFKLIKLMTKKIFLQLTFCCWHICV